MTIRHLPVLAVVALLLFGGSAFGFSEVDRLEAQLAAQRSALEKDRAALNADCGAVLASNTAKVASCRQRHDDVLRRMEKYKADYRNLQLVKEVVAGQRDLYYAVPDDAVRIPLGIELLAKKLNWSAEKQARLDAGLANLGAQRPKDVTEEDVHDTWNAIWDTTGNADLARAADAAGGPRRSVVGQRASMDCAVAAMATASGLPYDTVAAKARDLINQGEWRHGAADPDPLAEGLNGGELVLLANSLGRADVVPSSQFGKMLKSGRPVMINVAAIRQKPDFIGATRNVVVDHEVVLTKMFQHGGKTWYEMEDPSAPKYRFFATPEMLAPLMQEEGIAISPGR